MDRKFVFCFLLKKNLGQKQLKNESTLTNITKAPM